jgi:hypothetical protein
MITVRNQFETINAYQHIAGDSGGSCSARETAATMINVVSMVTVIDTERFWRELAELNDDQDGAMCELQEEMAGVLNDNAPLPPYCYIALEDNEWRVTPVIPEPEDVERVEGLPDDYTEEELLVVSDHGNATLYTWNPNTLEYDEQWGMV